MSALPIEAYRGAIVETITSNQVTIIVADTGAGKSTQVPQYLLDQGYRVLVTQPRRLAAATVAERVANERNTELGGEVGFRLGGGDGQHGASTRCLFVTEGLALVREVLGSSECPDVLVIDEVHEWGRDAEVLVAWIRRHLVTRPEFRVVLMSATLEAEKLSQYFDGAPIVSVPGRTYPVTAEAASESGASVWECMAFDIRRLVETGRNVLAFAPGKAEIEQLTQLLASTEAEVLPLHGELSRSEQRACFQRYPRPKVVVATNVAQTSITIDDIDAVVDSGLERRIEVDSGVEGLRLRLISQADSDQRRGRAGRTRPGIYVDHSTTARNLVPGVGERRQWPVPEIERVLLDQAVLRLAVAGIDLEELELFHQPSRAEIHAGKEVLKALGLLDADNQVTPIGRRVARLPVGVRTGRMLEHATKRNIGAVAMIAAIVEVGGIVDERIHDASGVVWRQHIAGETKSDHWAQYQLLRRAMLEGRSRWRKLGLHVRSTERALETLRSLKRSLRFDGIEGDRESVLECVVTGLIDQVRLRLYNRWNEATYDGRKLGRESCVAAPEITVGMPFDISTKRGGVMGLLGMVTGVTWDQIRAVDPDGFAAKECNWRYDPGSDSVRHKVETTYRIFRFPSVLEETTTDREKAKEAFLAWAKEMSLSWNRPENLRAYNEAATRANHCLGRKEYPSATEVAMAWAKGHACAAEAGEMVLPQIAPEHAELVPFDEWYGRPLVPGRNVAAPVVENENPVAFGVFVSSNESRWFEKRESAEYNRREYIHEALGKEAPPKTDTLTEDEFDAIVAERERVFAAEEAKELKLEALERDAIGVFRAAGHNANRDVIRRVVRFCQDAIDRVPDALSVMREEHEQPYGRARRAESVHGQWPWAKDHPIDWKAWADIELIVFWLEHTVRSTVANQKPSPVKKQQQQHQNNKASGAPKATLGDLMRAKGLV